MQGVLLVAGGGAVGAVLRYAMSRGVIALGGEGYIATGAVNVIGAGALGFLAGWLAGHDGFSDPVRLGVTAGLLGGFTTFSTWAVETAGLWEQGRGAIALANLFIPIVVGMIAVFVGLAVGRSAAA